MVGRRRRQARRSEVANFRAQESEARRRTAKHIGLEIHIECHKHNGADSHLRTDDAPINLRVRSLQLTALASHNAD